MRTPILSPGATIGVFSPSGAFDAERLEGGIALLKEWGFQVLRAPNLGRGHRYLAGTDAERGDDLAWALGSPDLDCAWMARGGYGLARICSPLPPVAPDRVVVGFSDGTALHAALWSQGVGGLHGPVLHSLVDHTNEGSRERVLDCLQGRAQANWPLREIWPGEAEGPVVGGNLCMFASLAGTALQPDLRGCILVLEEISEPPYKVDRMLNQLIGSGTLKGVVAIALGEFLNTMPPPEWDLDGLLRELLEPLQVPVYAGAPVGHGRCNQAFFWGQPGVLADAGLVLG